MSHAMIMIDDAIRFAKRYGFEGARDGDRLVLKREPAECSMLLDLSREHEGVVTVARQALERAVKP